jgi:hypothetical protein
MHVLDPPTCLADGFHPKILGWIERREIDCAIWRRKLSTDLESWFCKADRVWPMDARVLAPLAHIDAVSKFLVDSFGHSSAAQQVWAADIADLARIFSAFAGTELLDIRLEIVSDDACRSFHRDRTPFRLVTTYHGPGTQLVQCANAARALDQQSAYAGPRLDLPAGAVALIRGDPEGRGVGMVHRSPPIEGAGVTRIFLCIDHPSPGSPPPWGR